MKSIHWTQHWHYISATLRLTVASLAGVATFFLLPSETLIPARLALTWSVAGMLYLLFSYCMMFFSADEDILTLSKKEDDGATVILLIIMFGALASLVSIVLILADVKTLPTPSAIKYIALVLVTYTISWLFVHTAFALHYAHAYYQEYAKNSEPPLLFASKLRPAYVDFLYFSIVIGMTCQTADVNIASTRLRFLVMIQGMTAFVFNASLLGLAINLISSAISFA
jgi:uncharacterized membrane protein